MPDVDEKVDIEAPEPPETDETAPEDLVPPDREEFPEVADEDLEREVADWHEEEKPDAVLPEKFKGKSLEDVVEAYLQLEQRMGQLSQETGELRKKLNQPVYEPTVRIPESEDEWNRVNSVAKLEPRDMAYSQDAVDYAYDQLGYSAEQIDDFNERDWANIRKDALSAVAAGNARITQYQLEQQEQQAQLASQIHDQFMSDHPDLNGMEDFIQLAEMQLMAERDKPWETWEEYSSDLGTRSRYLLAKARGEEAQPTRPQRAQPPIPPAAPPSRRPGTQQEPTTRVVNPADLARW